MEEQVARLGHRGDAGVRHAFAVLHLVAGVHSGAAREHDPGVDGLSVRLHRRRTVPPQVHVVASALDQPGVARLLQAHAGHDLIELLLREEELAAAAVAVGQRLLASSRQRRTARRRWRGTGGSRRTRTSRPRLDRRLSDADRRAAAASAPQQPVEVSGAHRRIRRPVRVPAHVEPGDVAVHAADAVRQPRRDVDDVAHLDRPGLAAEDLALLEHAARRERAAALEHHPQVGGDRDAPARSPRR